MKLVAGVQRFIIQPENDVDRAYLTLLQLETAEIHTTWDTWEESPTEKHAVMPVLEISFKTNSEKLEESK
jgi:hypothetical protein